MTAKPAPIADNVVRQQQYQMRHPDARIKNVGPFWYAELPWLLPGVQEISKSSLGQLMDALEALEERDVPGPG
jgi:hypothetical protein